MSASHGFKEASFIIAIKTQWWDPPRGAIAEGRDQLVGTLKTWREGVILTYIKVVIDGYFVIVFFCIPTLNDASISMEV